MCLKSTVLLAAFYQLDVLYIYTALHLLRQPNVKRTTYGGRPTQVRAIMSPNPY